MSSSSTSNQLSSLIKVAQLGLGALKIGASPVSAGVTGFVTMCRFLAYTTIGRATVLVMMLLCTFVYFKHHFTALEAHKWQVAVEKKQEEIVGKVATVNEATRRSQELARAETGWWDKIVAVVVDGIQKTQPPHPIEKETIDLINETRGPQKR
jgi:hypothetical protein